MFTCINRYCERLKSIIVVLLMVLVGFSGLLIVTDQVVQESAGGPTYVSWIISKNTTWIKTNSPYIVESNVLVQSNVTLTIEPGVMVKFDGKYHLRIDGEIRSIGTETDNILFTSNRSKPGESDWSGIKIYNSKYKAENIIKYTNFRFCDIAVSINMDFKNNYTSNLITNNNFDEIYYSGVHYYRNENVTGYTEISNNTFNSAGNEAVYVSCGNWNNIVIIIKNNTLINGYSGILTRGENYGGAFYIVGNKIINNTIGIDIRKASPIIKSNYIYSNHIGIYFDSGDGNTVVERNSIKNNTNGIYITDYGSSLSVHNNNFENSIVFHVNHTGIHDYNMTYNWWDTKDNSLIGNKLFDYYDDFNYGKIIYQPFLTSGIKFSLNIANQKPLANAGPDQNVSINQTVYFDGRGSYDLENDPLTYSWDFGDGSTTKWQNDARASHNYSVSGKYIVKLTINDGKLTDTDTCVVEITSLGKDNDTKVSGLLSSDTIWNKENSPYIVTGNITLMKHTSLTIEAGTTILFTKYSSIIIRGALKIAGTITEPVLIKSKSSLEKNAWKGIFINTREGGKIEVHFGEFSNADSAIYVEGGGEGPILIYDSKFKNNNQAIMGYTDEFFLIERCTFESNNMGVGGGKKIIENSTFKNNDYGIYEGDWVNIYKSFFSGNNIAILGKTGMLMGCTIKNNDIGIQERGGSYLTFFNEISGNNIGMKIVYTGGFHAPTSFNNIFNNSEHNIIAPSIYDTKLNYNWWGTTEPNVIDKFIYDIHDDEGLGQVIYKPFLNSPINILNPLNEDIKDQLGESDIDGDNVPDYIDISASHYSDIDGDTLSDDYEIFILHTDYEKVDTDNDGYNDNIDGFPLDPLEYYKDTDKDGIPDYDDAFPIDIAASVDTDGDGYPDRWNPGKSEKDSTTGLSIDAYPLDPGRHIKKPSEQQLNIEIILFIIVIIVIALILSMMFMFIKPKHKRSVEDLHDHTLINQIVKELKNSEQFEDLELTDDEFISMLDKKFESGEISKSTFDYISNNIIGQEEPK